MSTAEHGHEHPGIPPAQGRPARSDEDPSPDTQVGLGDDAAGAVGSDAPPEQELGPDDPAARSGAAGPAG